MTKLALVRDPGPEPLLDAAGRLFREKGFAATSIRDIAEAAGVWPGSVHYRFRTKEAVLLALIERGIAIAESSFRTATAQSSDPVERIRLAIRAHVAMLAGNDHGTYVLLYEGRQLDGDARTRMARLRDRYDALWDGLLYQAVGAGRFQPSVDVRLARLLILGAINWVPQWYSEGGPLTPDQIADAFADRLLEGLLIPRPRPRPKKR
jgi:AcrR family transcriptional regulator